MSRCLLSIDVEDWYHAHNLRQGLDWSEWDRYEPRVVENTYRILDLLDEHNTNATFFVLGYVAERHPELVEEIDRRGHEIGSHGYNHELLYEQSEAEVRDDIKRSLNLIEPLVTQPIEAYRAPSFSIIDSAIDTLVEFGFSYDSSIVATGGHDRYGAIDAVMEGRVSEIREGFFEFQLPVLDVFGVNVPWGGGGYFRVLPYGLFRRGVRRLVASGDFVFYLHPWELDPDAPVVKDVPLTNRVRHYTNLKRTERRFELILDEFDWHPIGSVLEYR